MILSCARGVWPIRSAYLATSCSCFCAARWRSVVGPPCAASCSLSDVVSSKSEGRWLSWGSRMIAETTASSSVTRDCNRSFSARIASKPAFCFRKSERTSTSMSAGDIQLSRICCSISATWLAARRSSSMAAAVLRYTGRRDAMYSAGAARMPLRASATSSSSNASSMIAVSLPISARAASREAWAAASTARRSCDAGISPASEHDQLSDAASLQSPPPR
eukprot:scaffold103703_cov60-Phaeocystis_antarctica.AAC.6